MVEPKENSKKDDKEDALEAFECLSDLKGERKNFEDFWQEVADLVLPNKNEIIRDTLEGDRRTNQIYDSTGIQSNELLAGALHGMLTNPSAYFFELTTGNKELDAKDKVRKWLQDSAHIMHDVMNNSNFQTEIHEVYLDLGSFGIAVMSIEEDAEKTVRFLSRHIVDCYMQENVHGFIDTLYRSYKWTAKDIKKEFGEENLSPELLRILNGAKKKEKFELIHVVKPRDNSESSSKNPKKYKYSSCNYIKAGSVCEKLSESGFRTYPYVTPRWTKATGETYGRSPAMKCFPDIKMIQEMMKSVIRGAQKSVDPSLAISDDGVLGTIRLYPGGINYVRGNPGDVIRPIETGSRVDIGVQVMEDVRGRIKSAFFVDQLQLQEGPQMTATEVLQRTEEKIRLLGPILGRQHSELLRPLIDRVFEICIKRGKIPPIPEELKGVGYIDVKYRSMLAKAQLATEANNIVRVFQAASPFIQIDPKVVDLIDADQGLKYIANLYGLPQELLRDTNKVGEIRAARDQANANALEAARQQQGVEQVSTLAPAVETMSKVASK